MSGKGQSSIVKVESLTCFRGGRTLFGDMSFALASGDALLVTGPNGVGKSSLLRLIAGLLRPASGTVNIGARISLASDALALDQRQSLLNALCFWSSIDGGDAPLALSMLGIGHLADVPVHMLSTGQRKRAILARTIASKAKIWLLDEPGNGLDRNAIKLIEQAIAVHRAEGGIAIVTSHQPLELPDAQQLEIGS